MNIKEQLDADKAQYGKCYFHLIMGKRLDPEKVRLSRCGKWIYMSDDWRNKDFPVSHMDRFNVNIEY